MSGVVIRFDNVFSTTIVIFGVSIKIRLEVKVMKEYFTNPASKKSKPLVARVL